MDADARKVRGDKPFLFCDFKSGRGMDELKAWFDRDVLFTDLADAETESETAAAS